MSLHRSLFVGAVALLGACATRPDAVESVGVPPEDPPTYAEIAAAWNERVGALDTVWGRTTLIFETRDEKGGRLREQVEGHIQLERPDRLALTLGKLGDTYLYIGADETRYWWFDLVQQDNKTGFFGRHESFSVELAVGLGLPVAPRDLIALLGVRPLAGAAPQGISAVRWDVQEGLDGVVIELIEQRPSAGTEGVRRIWIDPDSMRPLRIAIESAESGRVAADLEAYSDYLRAGFNPRAVPGRVVIRGDAFDGVLRLGIYDPQKRDINPLVFRPDDLARRFRIDRFVDLDDPEVRERILHPPGPVAEHQR